MSPASTSPGGFPDGSPAESPSDRPGGPLLAGVVVHWHNEEPLARLVEAWPRDPRFELVVVDNGSADPLPSLDTVPGPGLVRPGRNLGFAGGVARGVAATTAPLVLILNPDAAPEPGALESLLEGFVEHPDAAGLAPRLVGLDGAAQWPWQLQRLPTAAGLVLEGLAFPAGRSLAAEPSPGAPVEQPAAAALALRREALEAVGGMDERFQPAWFEDVDLARRLADAGRVLRYHPAATFRHGLGATVPRLGFGTFLWIYHRNRLRYLERHHGRAWAWLGRWTTAFGMAARLAALPLRRPRRAASRGEAVRGLATVALGAATGFARPATLARRFGPAGEPGGHGDGDGDGDDSGDDHREPPA